MSKPFYFTVIIGVVMVGLVALLLPQPATKAVKQVSSEVVSPFWRALGWFQKKADVAEVSLRTIDKLEEEVQTLRARNAQLSTENARLQSLKDENARMREMLDFERPSPFRLLACRVVKRDPSSWWSAVIVNRGWSDDRSLAPDQPVITPRGIVGKTGEVAKYTTQVILLVDENCKISSEVEGSGARGIVIGASGANMGKSLCRMTYIARDSELPIGARVFSSGLGGNFPQGLLLGTIKDAPPVSSERNFGLFRDALIEPAIVLNDLREMFIVVGVK